MKKTTVFGVLGVALAAPFIASAGAAATDLSFFQTLLGQLGNLINAAVPIVVGLAVLLFLWGLATYILNQDDEEKRKGARSLMIWGIVIIFVMVALWGLVGLLAQLTGVGTGGAAVSPPTPIGP